MAVAVLETSEQARSGILWWIFGGGRGNRMFGQECLEELRRGWRCGDFGGWRSGRFAWLLPVGCVSQSRLRMNKGLEMSGYVRVGLLVIDVLCNLEMNRIVWLRKMGVTSASYEDL
jgi:hypothetical protein